MILKNFWAHRRQNGFVFVEIVLITVLSFYLTDHICVWGYSKYFCHAAGEFEKEHLVVGQTARLTEINTDSINGEPDILAPLYAFRDEVQALPEVQSVCLTQHFIGSQEGWWGHHAMAPEADTTRTCIAYNEYFTLREHYFETTGITAIEGCPSAEVLSRDCPDDGVVITRSLARQLFGTDHAVGRRMVQINYKAGPDNSDVEYLTHHTVFGVVEDVKPAPQERYCYIAFFPLTAFTYNTPMMLIRLKSEADAEAFVSKYGNKGADVWAGGAYTFAKLNTYEGYQTSRNRITDYDVILTLLGTLGVLFLLNVLFGTLGTYWLQIRKRTEDFGIMRSFGAKRRHIFGMLWGEAALLTLAACIVGQLIWLQVAIRYGLSDGEVHARVGNEVDWVNTFWSHFLIVSTVQYLVLLAIVSLGIFVPALIAMYKRPVEALHHE